MGALLLSGIAMWSAGLSKDEAKIIKVQRDILVRTQDVKAAVQRVIEEDKTLNPDRVPVGETRLSLLEQLLAARRRVLAYLIWDSVWARCKASWR